MRSWEEVHRLHDQENRSARVIARTLGMSRNTVRRLLALPEPPRHGRLRSGSRLDPYRATIQSLLELEPKMPATVMRRRLVELGYSGGITILKEYLATVRPQFLERTTPNLSSAMPVRISRTQDSLPSEETKDDRSYMLVEPESEPGMNLISNDFEIIMVNRVNERLFKKPMVELLGKKCYREFERRHEVCPHCPGAAALATGHPHRVEARGIRDDGTKYAVRLTAYPILGPMGAPVGFVEVEEDITERKRSERLAELFEDLQTSLAATHDMGSAVRQALNVAFSLEGVDFGCAYVWEQAREEYRTIAQRGVSRDLAEVLARRSSVAHTARRLAHPAKESSSSDLTIYKGQTAVMLVPITHDGLTVARLLLGSSTYAEFPPATNAALEALGKIVGSAIASFKAEELERETRADVEALLASLPVAIWCVDDDGRVILWNRAAERAFGWKAGEVLNSHLPFSPEEATGYAGSSRQSGSTGTDPSGQEFRCPARNGTPLRVRATTMPLPRVIGSKAGSLTLAEEIGVEIADSPGGADDSVPTYTGGGPPPVGSTPRGAGPPGAKARVVDAATTDSDRAPRLLVIEHDDAQRRVLTRILRGMGCSAVGCSSVDVALAKYFGTVPSKRPFDLVIGELLPPTGLGGLELAGRLRKLAPQVQVVLSADSPIVGFESHGLAEALQRPYSERTVRDTIQRVLMRTRHSQQEVV
ncbi:MAG: PAS domain S-box protein [bacterium]